MRRSWIALALLTGLVAACTTSGNAGSSQADATVVGATQVAAGATATSTSPAGGAPSTPVACTLITADEVRAALGEPVSPSTNSGAGENTCVFSGQSSYGINFVEITVINPAEFTPTQQSVPGSFTVTPVTSIGDAAYYKKTILPNTGGESIIDLAVRKGQTTFTVAIVNHSSPDSPLMTGEKTLALAALGRI